MAMQAEEENMTDLDRVRDRRAEIDRQVQALKAEDADLATAETVLVRLRPTETARTVLAAVKT